jgi:hypothetical protein
MRVNTCISPADQNRRVAAIFDLLDDTPPEPLPNAAVPRHFVKLDPPSADPKSNPMGRAEGLSRPILRVRMPDPGLLRRVKAHPLPGRRKESFACP